MSKIEWTDETWNPVTGCTRVSAGCDHCYAARMSRRLEAMGQAKYAGLTTPKHFNGRVQFWPSELGVPYTWRKPRRVFVCSMSDLFHNHVPHNAVCEILATVYECQQHTFQVLTKRPVRMCQFFERDDLRKGIAATAWTRFAARHPEGAETLPYDDVLEDVCANWPLPNLWIGTSVEDQQTADHRIPELLKCPAAVRFLSCEPLLGPVDLDAPWHGHTVADPTVCQWCGGYLDLSRSHDCYDPKPGIDWVIVGGESGPGARPMHPAWVRSIRDQCREAGVPFFFKQWGDWFPRDQWESNPELVLPDDDQSYFSIDHSRVHCFDDGFGDMTVMHRVGKKASGRILDGREWNEFPEPAAVPI